MRIKILINELLKQINLLNLILVATIAVFAIFVLAPAFRTAIKVPVIALPATEQKKSEPITQPANPPLQEYAVVTEKNLFHPGRILPPLKKVEDVPRPEFVLYGTLITDTLRIAYLVDNKQQRSTPGRGKRQTGLKLGENMSGYTLKEVLPDRVIMVRGDDRMEIKVIAPGVKKNRGGDGVAPAAAKPGMPAAPAVSPPPGMPATSIIPPAPASPNRSQGTLPTRSLRGRQNIRQ
jgi:hypothetical protein